MPAVSAAAEPPQRDPFSWLSAINQASAVMVVEQAIVPRPLGARIAAAVAAVTAAGDQPGAQRSGNYLIVERALIEAGGPDVTRLHAGRSRQDIGATIQRLSMRDDLLAAFAALAEARASLLAMAARHAHAIVPAYTWGVQAQPISFGHYILAYAEALTRTAERMTQAYARLNRSPLGAAALGTSSFPVDRPRLAALLGFDGVVENSFDANQLSPIDGGAELVGIAAAGAAHHRHRWSPISPCNTRRPSPGCSSPRARRPAPAASCRRSATRAGSCSCARKRARSSATPRPFSWSPTTSPRG